MCEFTAVPDLKILLNYISPHLEDSDTWTYEPETNLRVNFISRIDSRIKPDSTVFQAWFCLCDGPCSHSPALFLSLSLSFFLLYVCVTSSSVCARRVCLVPKRLGGGVRSSGAAVADSPETPCGCWEAKLVPWLERVLSTAEPPPQPHKPVEVLE